MCSLPRTDSVEKTFGNWSRGKNFRPKKSRGVLAETRPPERFGLNCLLLQIYEFQNSDFSPSINSMDSAKQ